MAKSTTRETADVANVVGRKNLIINGRLGSDTMVNQRGFTSGTLADDAYGFDRWMSKSGASSITLNASNITLTSGKLVQIIENPFISGESVTVSASVSSGTLTGRLGTTDAFQTLPFTTTASSGDIRLELVGNGSVFTNVQLELGSVATDFEHRSYGEELALCQRYFERRTYLSGAVVSMGQAYSSVHCAAPLDFIQKRATPTITLPDSSEVGFSFLNSSAQYPPTYGTLSVVSISLNNCRVQLSGGSGYVSGSTAWFHSGAVNVIDIDAEIY
jgi:hypothetical protein